MPDIRKTHISIQLWREDVIKYRLLGAKKSLSEYVRELFHAEMSRHRMPRNGLRMLDDSVALAAALRRQRSGRKAVPPSAKGGGVLTVDTVDIPAKVRRRPVFVKNGGR